MFSIRNTRLLGLALFITVGFLYIGWSRPVAWDSFSGAPGGWTDVGARPGAEAQEGKPVTIPEPQTDLHVNHGSVPPGAASPQPPHDDDKDSAHGDNDYDFERPTTADEAGYPPTQAGAEGKADQAIPPKPKPDCPSFEQYMRSKPGPPSAGARQFPLVRPPPECRTYPVPAVDAYIEKMETSIKDPDLYRLFQNSFPNTLDTMVKWHGFAQDADGNATTEELSYIITGDIDAMWLRDSASQLYSYLSFLSPHHAEFNDNSTSLNSLWRGLINAHARYLLISPYCHSFQPPPESGIPPTVNGAYRQNNPRPAYDPSKVFDCKWELDSLASFLQVSVGYWTRTHDLAFFARYRWLDAVQAAVAAAAAMRLGTYDEAGRVQPSAWTFTGWTNRGSETLTNDGLGNPVRANGMVRTAFRPSDDATIFQLLVPANMMWAKYLEEASAMMTALAEEGAAGVDLDPAKRAQARDLAASMRAQALGIREGIDADAIVPHKEFGAIFAYECDGYGGVNLMDDANVPSLLSMPLFQYAASRYPLPAGAQKRDYHAIYQNTRRFAMSAANPYWAQGPALSAVGGPHLGPGKAWPMAALVAGMTAFEAESGFVDARGKSVAAAAAAAGGGSGDAALVAFVSEQLGMVLNSTSGWGVVHESVNSWHGESFTRAWFGWANGLLGELVVRMEAWEAQNLKAIVAGGGQGLLGRSWQ